MKNKTLLTTCLSLALTVAFAASGFAAPWTAPDVASEFTKSAGTWTSGPVAVDAGSVFNFDFKYIGSWDAESDLNTRRWDDDTYRNPLVENPGKRTWDTMTINVRNSAGVIVASQFYGELDGGGNGFNPRHISDTVHYDTLLSLAGVYTFEAIGVMTMDNPEKPLEIETWKLVGANVTPTPIPAAVWLLGSGLAGLMGYKRTRKNAAAA